MPPLHLPPTVTQEPTREPAQQSPASPRRETIPSPNHPLTTRPAAQPHPAHPLPASAMYHYKFELRTCHGSDRILPAWHIHIMPTHIHIPCSYNRVEELPRQFTTYYWTHPHLRERDRETHNEREMRERWESSLPPHPHTPATLIVSCLIVGYPEQVRSSNLWYRYIYPTPSQLPTCPITSSPRTLARVHSHYISIRKKYPVGSILSVFSPLDIIPSHPPTSPPSSYTRHHTLDPLHTYSPTCYY